MPVVAAKLFSADSREPAAIAKSCCATTLCAQAGCTCTRPATGSASTAPSNARLMATPSGLRQGELRSNDVLRGGVWRDMRGSWEGWQGAHYGRFPNQVE